MTTMTSPPARDPREQYHEIRLPHDPRRDAVWRAICRYLQPWVSEDEGLLELGAGTVSSRGTSAPLRNGLSIRTRGWPNIGGLP